ncbi:hypothetical protein P9112_012365 [Eukaryota sp. TZLM1-RC]
MRLDVSLDTLAVTSTSVLPCSPFRSYLTSVLSHEQIHSIVFSSPKKILELPTSYATRLDQLVDNLLTSFDSTPTSPPSVSSSLQQCDFPLEF